MMFSEAEGIARRYIGPTGRIKSLGFGVDGFVFLAIPSRRVVKIFASDEKFRQEVKAYTELTIRGVEQILGLAVPQFVDFDEELKLLEIGPVEPPFLLDFASVLFEEPDFEHGIYAGWHDRMYFRFGGNTWFVVAVYNALAAMGMYYMDMHRGNLNFTGIEGIDENDFGPDDEATPV